MAGYILPLSFEEMNGKRRTLVLRERSLPYKGCSFVNGTQKIEVTYFPGNPVAFSQVLGPEFGSTTLNGWWKDKFIRYQDNAPVANRFPQVTAYGQPPPPSGNLVFGNTFASAGIYPGGAQLLQRAATVRDAFELLRTSGALIKVDWRDVARFGHLKRTNFNEHAGDEIEFELEFVWTGTTDAQPKVQKKSFKAKGLLDSLIGIIKGITNLLATASYSFRMYVGRFASKIAELLNALNGLVKSLTGFLDFKKFGGELIGGIKASFYALRDSLRALFDLFDGDDHRLSSSRDMGDNQYGSLLMSQLRQILTILAEEIADQLELLEEQTARTTQQLYEVNTLKSLRDVAIDVYGSFEQWRQIMVYNNMSSSFVTPGVTLKIPKLGT